MSTSTDSCKVGASKSNDDVCEVTDMLQNIMSTAEDKDIVSSVCANCGKDGANNICNKCKKATYCNAVCKKVHKKKHKKECEEYIRLATEKHNEELRIAAELHDKKLFEQPPPLEDCPICFERLPTLEEGRRYKTCCGKVICCGCVHAPLYDNQGNIVTEKKCPFCRTSPTTTDKEVVERYKKRLEAGDSNAIHNLGCYYQDGLHGYPQDYTKALELWHRAEELGHSKAYCRIGYSYDHGRGVEVDKKKAKYYYELAAMRGSATARHNLGFMEANAGNIKRALKHFMIAVRDGDNDSLKEIKHLYSTGYATKEDYTKALQLYQEYLGEIKSAQRDKAAAADEKYRYY